MKSTTYKGIFFALASGVSWGTYGVFSTILAKNGVTQQSISMLASLTVFFYFLAVTLTRLDDLKAIPLRDKIGATIGMGIANFGTNYCYSGAYANGMPTSIVSTVAFCNTLFVMLASCVLFKTKITAAKVLSGLVALVGIMLTLGVSQSGLDSFSTRGLIFTLLIPLFFADSTVTNKYYIHKGYDADVLMLFLGLGSVFNSMVFMRTNPITVVRDLAVLSTENSAVLFGVVGMILVPEIMSYGTQQTSLRHVEPTIFAICYAVDPLVATVLGFLVFQQTVTGLQVVGILTVLAAVCVLSWSEGRASKKAELTAAVQERGTGPSV